MAEPRDHGLDALLALDGESFVADPDGKYWVKFVVKRVEPSPQRPHGLSYSLTLHDETGNRLVGFDNAHPPPRGRRPGERRVEHDHRHRFQAIQPYTYRDAATLLADFWTQVDAVLRERGVIR